MIYYHFPHSNAHHSTAHSQVLDHKLNVFFALLFIYPKMKSLEFFNFGRFVFFFLVFSFFCFTFLLLRTNCTQVHRIFVPVFHHTQMNIFHQKKVTSNPNKKMNFLVNLGAKITNWFHFFYKIKWSRWIFFFTSIYFVKVRNNLLV